MTTKVVCIYHFRRERAQWPGIIFPAYGAVYTLIDIVKELEGTWFLLAEIENEVCWHGGWWHERFRPLIEPIPAYTQTQKAMA